MILNEIIYYLIMNIDKSVSQINSSLNVVLKQNLAPFVDEINNNNKQHELIKSILFQMPEYKNLEKKYDELQKRYNMLQRELKNREIGLEINEISEEDGEGRRYRRSDMPTDSGLLSEYLQKKCLDDNVVEIYTDGACKGNPGNGGWGVYIIEDGVESKFCGGM